VGVTVREKPKGSGIWWVFTHKGRDKRSKCIGDRRLALKIKAELEAVMTRGALQLAPRRLRVAELAEEWLGTEPVLRAQALSTRENAAAMLRQHILPDWGGARVADITAQEVEAWVLRKLSVGGSRRNPQRALSRGTVKLALGVFRQVLDRAVRNQTIPVNPARVVRARFGDTLTDENVDPFSVEELGRVLELAWARDREFAVFIRLWAQAGMREGEVFALRPGGIDWQEGTALVRQTWTRGRLGPPKGKRPRRVSLLHPVCVATPEWRPDGHPDARRVLEQLSALKLRGLDPEAFLFGGKTPWRLTTIYGRWRRLLLQAGVPYRNPEQLRHTFASTLLSRNAPLPYVQEQGGWRSAAVLLRVYVRWLPQPDFARAQGTKADAPTRALGAPTESKPLENQ
jgi:integrase